jgi:hypothetical protein
LQDPYDRSNIPEWFFYTLVRLHEVPAVLHPNQFHVNEAWIAFQLNYVPIDTERDGSFNCICLMDAASCFILGNALVPANESEPSEMEVRRLFKASWKHKKGFPTTLLIPKGQFRNTVPTEAERHGIAVVAVDESQLLVFIGDARQGYEEYLKCRGQRE